MTNARVQVEAAYVTDPGLEPSKQVNEDVGGFRHTAQGALAVVCDGMGGHADGQAAARTALENITGVVTQGARDETGAPLSAGALLVHAIQVAGAAVYHQGGGPDVEARPGSTCVALLIQGAQAFVAHVGDSRLYLIRGGHIHRVTRDHSMVQDMIDAGLLTEEQAKHHPDSNRITRALGMAPHVDVELMQASLAVLPGDLFLLCSDGLTDLVTDPEISSIAINRLADGLEVASRALVDMAKLRGGHDNITVLMARIQQYDDKPTVVDPGAAPTQIDDVITETDHSAAPGGEAPPATMAPATQKSEIPTQPDIVPATGQGNVPVVNAAPGLAGQPGQTSPGPTAPAFQHHVFGTTLPEGQTSGDFDSPRTSAIPGGRKGKVLLLLAAVSTLLIVGAIVLWWLLAALTN